MAGLQWWATAQSLEQGLEPARMFMDAARCSVRREVRLLRALAAGLSSGGELPAGAPGAGAELVACMLAAESAGLTCSLA